MEEKIMFSHNGKIGKASEGLSRFIYKKSVQKTLKSGNVVESVKYGFIDAKEKLSEEDLAEAAELITWPE